MSGSNHINTQVVAKISAAYFSRNHVPTGKISCVMREISNAVFSVEEKINSPSPHTHKITEKGIVCAECGKAFKQLKKHLNCAHGLSVDQYLKKHNLPKNTPVVLPELTKKRSEALKEFHKSAKAKGK